MTETLNVIGDRTTARVACSLFMAWQAQMQGDFRYGEPPPLISGWKNLGRGCSRIAYLGPDGVVYKVGWGDGGANEALAYAIKGMIDHPTFAIPAASSFTFDGAEGLITVGAVEYCGEDECGDFEQEYCDCDLDEYDCDCGFDPDYYCSAETFFGTSDLHAGNLRWYKGKIYCIDLGSCDFVY